MRVAIAQVRPHVGQVEKNIERHLALTAIAVRHQAKLVVFPELSLTGYEPSQASELARSPHDSCFDPLQAVSRRDGVCIGVGVPLRTHELPRISTLQFRPDTQPLIYSKMYLHPDELPFFTPGIDSPALMLTTPPIALAICYELAIPQHARQASKAGAIAYIASVAKTATGVASASKRLSEIAAEYSMPALMSNCLGVLDGANCTGGSSVWNRQGELMAHLDDQNEGVIVVDVKSCEVVAEVRCSMLPHP